MKTTRTTSTFETPHGGTHEIIRHEGDGCTIEITRPVGHGGGRYNTVRVNGALLLDRNGNARLFHTETTALAAGMKAANERTFLDRTIAAAQAEAGRQAASAAAAPAGPTDEQMLLNENIEVARTIGRLEVLRDTIGVGLTDAQHGALHTAQMRSLQIRDDLEACRARNDKMTAREKTYLTITAKNKVDQIAADILGIESLAPVNSDRADFHEIACWNLQAALVAAYMAGRTAGKAEAK
jgi:hypothetical protein